MRVQTTIVLLLVAALSGPVALCQESDRPVAWLGVTLGSVPEETPPERQGVLVTGVVRDSPADRAGLRGGDVVTHVGGGRVLTTGDLIAAVRAEEIGGWVELRLLRRGRERTASARLDERPDRGRLADLKRAWSGLFPIDVPDQLKEHWGGSSEAGVLVGAIDEGSPADEAGLSPGDLILAVDGGEIASARALAMLLRRSGIGNTVELEVSRQGTLLELEMDLREPPPEPAEDDLRDDS